ncbi:hypothetical protein [Accumulibacter sp.]|uniref:hypothetical protein n=1 Tax=Accumulibacter sp. TaxID=2053492 RepID=UPI0025E2CB8A|nr:hypothetical protein [Accumulibacter sp.]MCP5228025.1 hypothetical protein [Accumulibacter sp.]
MSLTLKPYWRSALVLLGCASLLYLIYASWRQYYPVNTASGWEVQVYRDDIAMVSALALDGKGGLYVSQEISDGRGKILELKADGSLSDALIGLSKPDGQVMFRDGLVTGQEGGTLPVLWLRHGKAETLFAATNVEGIATDGQVLYAIEDARPGRLLRFAPDSGELTVLRAGLDDGEGVSLCADGRLFYTEKRKGWVKLWQADGPDIVVADGLNAPGYLQCTADGLWITEDATHLARVLLLDAAGKLEVVVKHLRSAQTIIPLASGSYLLAEQGRRRILKIDRLAAKS